MFACELEGESRLAAKTTISRVAGRKEQNAREQPLEKVLQVLHPQLATLSYVGHQAFWLYRVLISGIQGSFSLKSFIVFFFSFI